MDRLVKGIVLVACILMGALIVAVSSQGKTQSAASPDSEVGRYQIVSAGSAMNPFIYFIDTKTGETWMANSPAASQTREGWTKVPVPRTAGSLK